MLMCTAVCVWLIEAAIFVIVHLSERKAWALASCVRSALLDDFQPDPYPG
jgi:hypothetical protein